MVVVIQVRKVVILVPNRFGSERRAEFRSDTLGLAGKSCAWGIFHSVLEGL